MAGYLVNDNRKVTTHRFMEMKQSGEKISMLTSYDYTMAGIVDKAGIEKGFIKSDKQIKAESLAEGVQVYLDEKGNLTRIEE